jgi:hypothetical protein
VPARLKQFSTMAQCDSLNVSVVKLIVLCKNDSEMTKSGNSSSAERHAQSVPQYSPVPQAGEHSGTK